MTQKILLLTSGYKNPPLPLSLPQQPHLRSSRAVLQTQQPFLPMQNYQIPLMISTFTSQHSHMISQRKNSLSQFQIMHQVTLLYLKPQAFYKLLHMSYQHKNLPQFVLLSQMYTIPVVIPQSCLLYSHLIYLHTNSPSHMRYQQKNLPQFWILTQIYKLTIDSPQVFLLYSHRGLLQKNLPSHLI